MADALRMFGWNGQEETTTTTSAGDNNNNNNYATEEDLNASALNTTLNSEFVTEDYNPVEHVFSIPEESDLVLLCLDYLRDLRRSFSPAALQAGENVRADYLTLACWALTRALQEPELNVAASNGNANNNNPTLDDIAEGNDAWFDVTRQSLDMVQNPKAYMQFMTQRPLLMATQHNTVPSVKEMEDEVLYRGTIDDSSNGDQDADGSNNYEWYEYDDFHVSNRHRFYPLQGLASGADLPGPLTLGEIIAAGLVGLNAKTRRQAENAFCSEGANPKFEQYLSALTNRGFFDMDEQEDSLTELEKDQIYADRYNKVVAKFRVKIASNMLEEQQDMTADPQGFWAALTAAEQQRQRREMRRVHALQHPGAYLQQQQQQQYDHDHYGDGEEKTDKDSGILDNGSKDSHLNSSNLSHHHIYSTNNNDAEVGSNVGTEVSAASYVKRMAFASKLFPTAIQDQKDKFVKPSEKMSLKTASNQNNNASSEIKKNMTNPEDLVEAERLKNQGNTHMQQKKYEEAVECYTKALKLSPAGPQSHVYFSNRAAALVSLRQFEKAILDSERSLSLQPSYAKAHARLGLAHFLLGNYQDAKDAYEMALKFEPNNKSNQSYLEKSTKKLAEQQREDEKNGGSKRRGATPTVAPSSLKEAEKYKTKGNALMASREYESAYDAYTQALNCSSNGPQSHVYYSNRAAALCYLERYQDAELDSLKSLGLEPTYGKAHARLGLSRFFLHDYAGAVQAYTLALEYDPDNAASQSYLTKAKAKLAKQQQKQQQQQSNAQPSDVAAAAAAAAAATPQAKGASDNNKTNSSNSKTKKAKSPEEMDITARRLLYDENLRTMATKAMANPSTDLLNDPDMHEKARKAMAALRKS